LLLRGLLRLGGLLGLRGRGSRGRQSLHIPFLLLRRRWGLFLLLFALILVLLVYFILLRVTTGRSTITHAGYPNNDSDATHSPFTHVPVQILVVRVIICMQTTTFSNVVTTWHKATVLCPPPDCSK
jgi:hypothetical protein